MHYRIGLGAIQANFAAIDIPIVWLYVDVRSHCHLSFAATIPQLYSLRAPHRRLIPKYRMSTVHFWRSQPGRLIKPEADFCFLQADLCMFDQHTSYHISCVVGVELIDRGTLPFPLW